MQDSGLTSTHQRSVFSESFEEEGVDLSVPDR